MEIKYQNHIGTIKWVANHYHKKTGIEFDELISAGNECFVDIQKSFDESKSCFNTYLILKLRSVFLNLKAQYLKRQTKMIYGNKHNYINPEYTCNFANTIEDLPRDSKIIIDIILNTPDDFLNMIPQKQPRGINKYILTKYLKKNGWGIARILKAFNRIEKIWS